MNLRPLAPSIFTFSNGMLGMAAILAVATGSTGLALIFICIALICDGLDGMTARALGVPSEFGVQYDTANDCITFAVAPAVIGYFTLSPAFGLLAFVPCAVYAGCAIFRLARFNARKIEAADLPEAETKSTYDGMPSTGGALVLMAVVAATGFLGISGTMTAIAVTVALTLSGILMASTVQYGVLKHLTGAPWQFHLLVTLPLVLAGFYSWQIALLLGAAIYALHGPVMAIWQKFCR